MAKSSIPASMHATRSSGMALAVIATIAVRGRPLCRSRSRMATVASMPLMPGMRMSISTRS